MGSSVVGTPFVHRAIAALAALLTVAAVAMTAVQLRSTPASPAAPAAAPVDPQAELMALRGRMTALYRQLAAIELRDPTRTVVVARVSAGCFGDDAIDAFELAATHATWHLPEARPRGVAIDATVRRRLADALALSTTRLEPIGYDAAFVVIGDARVDVTSAAGVALTAVLAELEARAYADLAAAYADAVAQVDVAAGARYRIDRLGVAERRAGRWVVTDADPRRALDLLDDVFARAARRAPAPFARVTLTRAGRVTRGALADPPRGAAVAQLR